MVPLLRVAVEIPYVESPVEGSMSCHSVKSIKIYAHILVLELCTSGSHISLLRIETNKKKELKETRIETTSIVTKTLYC